MANYGWPDCKPVLIGGYDLGGTGVTTMELSIPGFQRVTEDATGAGSTWMQHVLTGEKMATGPLTLTAFYNDANDASDEALSPPAATVVITCGYEGGTAGTRFAGGLTYQPTYERTTTKGQLHKGKGSWLLTTQYDDQGKVLKALSAVTADGNSQAASIDNGASSANGGAAYFHTTALALGTATNLTLKVMHSTDDVTYAALATATAITVAPAAQQVVVTSGTTVNRYLAGLWDYGGTPDGSTTATIFIGFARR